MQGDAQTPLRRTPRESSSRHKLLRHCPLKLQLAPGGRPPDDGLHVVVNCGAVVEATVRTLHVTPAS